MLRLAILACVAAACDLPPPRAGKPVASTATSTPTSTPTSTATATPTSTPTATPTSSATPPSTPQAGEGVSITADRAVAILQLDSSAAEVKACLGGDADPERIHCLLKLRFAGDAGAAELALASYDELGDVIGLEVEHDMDGGWRGAIHLVPELPVGPHRRHLEWVLGARRAIDRFFVDLAKSDPRVPRYRHKPLALLFMRSVGKRTPSAYAANWTIAYNVSGSLHTSADAVRETMFHENFHLDDQDHGDWSATALEPIYQAIMKRCDVEAHTVASMPCLRPFAPSDTTVMHGTYYAFQPGNGVAEYAAELAVRYYREQLAMLAGRRLPKPPFKCGPDENARAWKLFVDEFFAGIDHTPECR